MPIVIGLFLGTIQIILGEVVLQYIPRCVFAQGWMGTSSGVNFTVRIPNSIGRKSVM